MYADGYIQVVLKNFLAYEFPFAFSMLDEAIDVYVCIYVCMYICMYVCMYVWSSLPLFRFFVGIVSAGRAGGIVLRTNYHIYISQGEPMVYVCMYVCMYVLCMYVY